MAPWLLLGALTEGTRYIEADLAMKERALAAIRPPNVKCPRFRPNPSLLAFLDNL